MKNIIIADIRSTNNRGNSIGHYFSVAQNYLHIFREKFNVSVSGGPIYHKNFKDILGLKYDMIEGDFTILNKIKALYNCLELLSKTSDCIMIFQSSAVVTAFVGIILKKNKN